MDERADAPPSGLDGALLGVAQQVLELGEDLLDRVEVGAVGRQKEELGASGADRLADGVSLVAAEIVHDHEVSGLERGGQGLLDIGAESLAVDRPVDHARRIDPVVAECSEEGERAPAAMGSLGEQLVAARPPAAQRRHVGLGPGLIDEDEPSWINPALIRLPLQAPSRDRGPILLAGEHGFF